MHFESHFGTQITAASQYFGFSRRWSNRIGIRKQRRVCFIPIFHPFKHISAHVTQVHQIDFLSQTAWVLRLDESSYHATLLAVELPENRMRLHRTCSRATATYVMPHFSGAPFHSASVGKRYPIRGSISRKSRGELIAGMGIQTKFESTRKRIGRLQTMLGTQHIGKGDRIRTKRCFPLDNLIHNWLLDGFCPVTPLQTPCVTSDTPMENGCVSRTLMLLFITISPHFGVCASHPNAPPGR